MSGSRGWAMTAFLLVLNLVLAVALVGSVQWVRDWGKQVLATTVKGANGGSKTVVGELPEVPEQEDELAEYDDLVQRPLFISTRRPPQEEPVAVAPPPPPEPDVPVEPVTARLSSVLITPEGDKVALVHDPASNAYKRLHQGDELEGWQVVGIENDSVLLGQKGELQMLKLWDFSTPRPAAARPAPPQRAARVLDRQGRTRPGRRAPAAGGRGEGAQDSDEKP